MTSTEYVEHDGAFCPACGREHIDADGLVRQYRGARQRMTCQICDATWTEEYRLKGYVGLESTIQGEQDASDN